MKGNVIMKKNIIIMALFIVIFILCIVLAISMNKKCDVSTPFNDNEVKTENLETTNEEVQNLLTNITTGIGEPCGLSSYYFTNNKVSISDLGGDVLFKIAVKQIVGDDYRVNFSLDSVTAKLKNTFGKKIQFKAQTYNIIPIYNYNYDTSTYEYQNDTGMVKVCTGDKNLVRVVKAEKKDNKLEVQVRVIFNKSGNYYSDPTFSNQLTNLEKIGNTISMSDTNMRQGSLYKIIFNKENNHYIFISSDLVR
ncbi:MAG: hypothetical protein IJL76_01290 [Bacilli bacterium]|nr:hypothetical protein [Bacilli bacterium]